ncbi:unnamed protein product [Rodentolepis nana]|uniref:Clat_adaptor_s domain-containing protein n=1 Tax=Rodentolepis nana TaxID=102285 RepID=A0A0R3TZB1_RODNA|nr:unnamed protein product [Rodentolepis nana]
MKVWADLFTVGFSDFIRSNRSSKFFFAKSMNYFINYRIIPKRKRLLKDSEYRVIYRQYSTIYIIICVDLSESEFGVLDLIQVFVDLLDRTFENVFELDIVFNSDKVHFLLNELVCGGIVLETNCAEIPR